MSIPAYTTIIEQLFTELDVLLRSYVFDSYSALAHALKYPLGLAVTLYIVILGISISQGWVKLSMSNFVKSVLKIGVIYACAMNWGFFSEHIVKFIQSGAGEIGNILVNSTPIPLPHFAGAGINGAIQTVLIEFTRVGLWIWNSGTLHNFAPYVTALMIWGFGYVMLLVALFELALAKIMLAILFATAPLFICFTLFKPTHGFFDRWLGAIVGFALLIIFVSSMLALALSIAQWSIGGMYVQHALNIHLVSFIPVMIVGFIGIGIILQAAQLAQSIGGTVTTSSGSSLLAGTIGGMIGGSLATMRLPKSALGAGKSLTNLLTFGAGGPKGFSPSSAFNAIRKKLIKS